MLLVVLYLFTIIELNTAANARVKAISGIYTGLNQSTFDGIPYYLFKGIKYANVVKRYKEAEPVPDSNKIFDATEFGPSCYQDNSTNQPIPARIAEDCLYLNLYTPDLNGSLPVIVFIHGGSYIVGSPNFYSGEYFMANRKAVIVIIAYRLNAFGFFYIDDHNYPANLGLRDQITALKWIQKNIKYFGGDPKKITISGQSAGGTSVNILMLSPLTKGLIAGGISESGPACSPGGINTRCFGIEKRNAFAKEIGCNKYLPKRRKSADKFVRCLEKKSAAEILTAMNKMSVLYSFLGAFVPIVESSSARNPVITQYPQLIRANSADLVPWLVGVNSNEGRGVFPLYPILNTTIRDMGPGIFKGSVLPDLLMFKYEAQSPRLATKALRRHYGSTYRRSYKEFMIELISNNYFFYRTVRCLRTVKSPIYSYYFNYTQPSQTGEGAGHGDELTYLWNTTVNIQQYGNPSSVQLSKNLVNAWVNFATNQVANKFSDTTWEKYDSARDNVLIINNDGVKMGFNPNHANNTFWQSLYTDTKPKYTQCCHWKNDPFY